MLGQFGGEVVVDGECGGPGLAVLADFPVGACGEAEGLAVGE